MHPLKILLVVGIQTLLWDDKACKISRIFLIYFLWISACFQLRISVPLKHRKGWLEDLVACKEKYSTCTEHVSEQLTPNLKKINHISSAISVQNLVNTKPFLERTSAQSNICWGSVIDDWTCMELLNWKIFVENLHILLM